jgi:hypothetical protein
MRPGKTLRQPSSFAARRPSNAHVFCLADHQWTSLAAQGKFGVSGIFQARSFSWWSVGAAHAIRHPPEDHLSHFRGLFDTLQRVAINEIVGGDALDL